MLKTLFEMSLSMKKMVNRAGHETVRPQLLHLRRRTVLLGQQAHKSSDALRAHRPTIEGMLYKSQTGDKLIGNP